MSLNHGINTYKSDTEVVALKTAGVGIPLFVGAWPCHTAGGFTGKPQLVMGFDEAKKLGGYSTEWRNAAKAPKWNLCQAMYSQFKLFGMRPAIFYNIFDPSKHKVAVTDTEVSVEEHVATIPGDAINDTALVVKADSKTLVKDTDYEVFYKDDKCFIELIEGGASYAVNKLTVSYNAANPDAITASDVEEAIEKVERCKSLFGIVPDLICCPGWSQTPSVAAVMAAKAPNINGLFKGKAVVDIDTDAINGADTYSKTLEWKNKNGYTDENMIVCWPLAKVGDYIFDMSVIACGVMARVDSTNEDCPYESPSNTNNKITGLCDKNGNEIDLTVQEADFVSYSGGIVTSLNFDGWVLWGNYTGCWPANSDISRCFICTNRMMDFVCNSFLNTYWANLDRPLSRVRMDAIVNSFNSWLRGLTREEKLYGGKIQYLPSANDTADIVAGKIRLDTGIASPVPSQRIDMYAEYDVEYLKSALSA